MTLVSREVGNTIPDAPTDSNAGTNCIGASLERVEVSADVTSLSKLS